MSQSLRLISQYTDVQRLLQKYIADQLTPKEKLVLLQMVANDMTLSVCDEHTGVTSPIRSLPPVEVAASHQPAPHAPDPTLQMPPAAPMDPQVSELTRHARRGVAGEGVPPTFMGKKAFTVAYDTDVAEFILDVNKALAKGFLLHGPTMMHLMEGGKIRYLQSLATPAAFGIAEEFEGADE